MPAVEVFQFHIQHGGLDRGQAEHAADERVMIRVAGAMHAQKPACVGECIVVGADRPGIAERAEVLRRIEAQAPGKPQRTGRLAVALRADRLGGIFDHLQFVLAGDRVDLVHFRDIARRGERA